MGNKGKQFCIQNNFNLIRAPAKNHQAIGVVEQLISAIKQGLECVKGGNKI